MTDIVEAMALRVSEQVSEHILSAWNLEMPDADYEALTANVYEIAEDAAYTIVKPRIDELEEALRSIVGIAHEAPQYGPFDQIDNDGDPYQSEAFEKALEKGRAALHATLTGAK